MAFEFWPAVVAGIIGGLVMSGMAMGMRGMGAPLEMNIARIWGTMLGLAGGTAMWVGFAIHLIVSAGIAIIYAIGFDLVGADNALWLWGLGFGVLHWAMAGLFMAMLQAMHPAIPERQPAPGAFATKYGMLDAGSFLMAHLVYRVLVGLLYAALHSAGGTDVAF